jgi:hypothetical protein
MYGDLFSQAETLAKLDPKKPKQANLRRAVSSAYYAVFHYLVHEACCVQIGTQHSQAPYRNALGRAFVHTVMKQACMSKTWRREWVAIRRNRRTRLILAPLCFLQEEAL